MTVNPFFNIERKPAFVEINGQNIEIGKDVLVNTETSDVVGVVGKGYSLVENNLVSQVFDEAFSNVRILSVKDHLNANTSRWVRDIVLDDDRFTREIAVGDTVKAKVRIYNGYDGKTALGFAVSAWRKVCANGMMGWKEVHGGNFTHIGAGLVDRIREQFSNNFNNFSRNFSVWEEWTKEGFDKARFELFIKTHTKTQADEGVVVPKALKAIEYLSEKQADSIKGMYEPIMNQFNETETKWGAYNVLTAIATHHTKARNGSPLFSAGYKRINKLVEDFYDF